VDYAENATLQVKAEMLLDLLLFDFANNYFKDIYAVAQGRIYGGTRVANVWGSMQDRDSISDVVWLWLGIGGFNGGGMGSSEAFALTSSYTPPPILEKIAKDAQDNNEHKDRNGLDVDEGSLYGVQYSEEDLMYWWGMTNFLNPEIIDISYEFIENNNIDPALIFGPGIIEITTALANLRGKTLSEYSVLLEEYTKGMALSAANSYTYRTPYFQLSGLQANSGAGGSAIQELIWQGSLSNDAYVFTNAPSGISWKGGPFMGGWKPYSVFFKNIGIIQYDHEHSTIEGYIIDELGSSLLNAFTGNRPRNHAYFPKWAFDEVIQKGKWTFGSKNGGYLALYSRNPTFWANDHELVALGKRNVWIIEMGSELEYASFEDFINQVKASDVDIQRENLGFSVDYNSPSQGIASVNWGGNFVVNGTNIDLSYERFENKYVVTADFNSTETIIEFNGERLTLNFENNTRLYEP
jgi:hypothetical protein